MNPPPTPAVCLTDALTESRRELALRRSTYPKWVAAGKLSPTVSAHRIACSEFIVERLQMLQMLRESVPLPPEPTPTNTTPAT